MWVPSPKRVYYLTTTPKPLIVQLVLVLGDDRDNSVENGGPRESTILDLVVTLISLNNHSLSVFTRPEKKNVGPLYMVAKKITTHIFLHRTSEIVAGVVLTE